MDFMGFGFDLFFEVFVILFVKLRRWIRISRVFLVLRFFSGLFFI